MHLFAHSCIGALLGTRAHTYTARSCMCFGLCTSSLSFRGVFDHLRVKGVWTDSTDEPRTWLKRNPRANPTASTWLRREEQRKPTRLSSTAVVTFQVNIPNQIILINMKLAIAALLAGSAAAFNVKEVRFFVAS